jgi:hypothetical protein
VGQQEADKNECSSESANDHFHKDAFLSSVETGRHQRSDDHAVETAGKWVARQWASPGRTADKFVVSEAQCAPDYRADYTPQNHVTIPCGSIWNLKSDKLAILFIKR